MSAEGINVLAVPIPVELDRNAALQKRVEQLEEALQNMLNFTFTNTRMGQVAQSTAVRLLGDRKIPDRSDTLTRAQLMHCLTKIDTQTSVELYKALKEL